MALRTPTWLSDVFKWRWLPTVALVLASLLYVLFALAFVPTDINFPAANPSASAPVAGLGMLPPGGESDAATDGDSAATQPASAEDSTPRRRRRRRPPPSPPPPSEPVQEVEEPVITPH